MEQQEDRNNTRTHNKHTENVAANVHTLLARLDGASIDRHIPRLDAPVPAKVAGVLQNGLDDVLQLWGGWIEQHVDGWDASTDNSTHKGIGRLRVVLRDPVNVLQPSEDVEALGRLEGMG